MLARFAIPVRSGPRMPPPPEHTAADAARGEQNVPLHRIARNLLLHRARRGAQERNQGSGVGSRHGERGHLGAGDSLRDAALQFVGRAAVFPLAGGEIRPTPPLPACPWHDEQKLDEKLPPLVGAMLRQHRGRAQQGRQEQPRFQLSPRYLSHKRTKWRRRAGSS